MKPSCRYGRPRFLVSRWCSSATSVDARLLRVLATPSIMLLTGVLAAQYVLEEPGKGPRRLGAPRRGTPGARAPYSPDAIQAAAGRFLQAHGPETGVLFLPGRPGTVCLSGFRSPAGTPAVSAPAPSADEARRRSVDAALAFVAGEPELAGVRSPGEELALDEVLAAGDLHIVRFVERRAGLPVLGGYLAAFVDAGGAVRGVISSLRRPLGDVPRPVLTLDQAAAVAHARLSPVRGGGEVERLRSGLAIADLGGAPRLIWDVWVRTETGPHRALVDARTGELIMHRSLLRNVDCSPRPRGDFYPISPAQGPAARAELDGLDCQSTFLSGEFIRSFVWTGEDPFTFFPLFQFGLRGAITPQAVIFAATASSALSQVTIYQHATLFHDYIRGLGFTGLDRPFPAVANADECYGYFPCANAFYDPLFLYATGPGILVFGRDFAVNYGLEADVICHEYTHAVVQETAALGEDFFDPDAFYSLALNEAFADYFSCSYLDDPALGEYIGTSMGQVPLRNLANSLHWPEDIDPNFYHDTGQIWSGALWDVRQAFSAGGTDPAGIRKTDLLVLATLASLPSNANFPEAAAALIAAASAQELSVAERTTVRDVLVSRGLAATGGETPQAIERLASGQQVEGDIAAPVGADFRLGSTQYEILVPQGGSRLQVEVEGSGDVDLYLRFNAPVTVQLGGILAHHTSGGPEPEEMIEVRRASEPPLVPGSWFVGIVNRTAAIATYSVRATIEVQAFEELEPLSFGEESPGEFLGGPALSSVQYTLAVPEAAGKRLVLRVTADADVSLHLRHGAAVEPGAEGGIIADASASTPAPAEELILDGLTIPPLRSGTYYVAVGNETQGAAAYSVEAELLDHDPPPLEEIALLPGVPAEGSVPGAAAGTGRLGAVQYTIDILEDATRLTVTSAAAEDIGLYLRRGERVALSEGRVLADHAADNPASGDETLAVDLVSSPPLEAGRYHIAVANRGEAAAAFALSASIETETLPGKVVNLPHNLFTRVVVEGNAGGLALFSTQYRVTVAADAPGLDVLTNPVTPGNVDLYVRQDHPVLLIGDVVVADFHAEGELGAEAITIPQGQLTPGSYYIALVSRGPLNVSLDLLAFYQGEFPLTVPAMDGDGFGHIVRPQPGPGCGLSITQFVVDVPANALRLEVRVTTPDGGPLEIFRRAGGRILINLGAIVFDQVYTTGAGPIVLEGAALTPGQQVFAAANCTEIDQRYDIFFYLRVPSGQEELQSGRLVTFTAEPAREPGEGRLQATQYGFSVDPDFVEVVFSAWGGLCAERDVDLHVARGERVRADLANALWSSTRRGPGAETVVINALSGPPLAPGAYFAAIVSREATAGPAVIGATRWFSISEPILDGTPRADTVLASTGGGRLHDRQYRIVMPEGAERLEARLRAANTALDIDLLARFGLPIIIEGGRPIVDQEAAGLTGVEAIDFPVAGDCVRPGTYFFAVGNFAPQNAAFELTATVVGAPRLMVRRGDADEDNEFNLTDAIGTLNFLFLGGRPVCLAAADVDGSRDLTITDPINFLNHLFLGGPPPVAPYPGCGVPEGELTDCTGAACR